MELDKAQSFEDSNKNTEKFIQDVKDAVDGGEILKICLRDMALQTSASSSLNAHVYIDNSSKTGLWTVDTDKLDDLGLELLLVDNSFMPTQECTCTKIVVDRE